MGDFCALISLEQQLVEKRFPKNDRYMYYFTISQLSMLFLSKLNLSNTASKEIIEERIKKFEGKEYDYIKKI